MRRILLTSLLASTAFGGNAQAESFGITFSNLCDGDRCIDVSGRFVGMDLNNDGHIALEELQELDAGGWGFRPGGVVYSFDYAIGASNFDAIASIDDYRISVGLVTGQQFSVIAPGYDPTGQFLWNDRTTVAVTPLVPEPRTCVLLALGLGVLLRREVRRQSELDRGTVVPGPLLP